MQIFHFYISPWNVKREEAAAEQRVLLFYAEFSNVCNLLGHRFDDLVEADTAEKMKFWNLSPTRKKN